MRIRTIKPEFWYDEDLSGISETAVLLAIGLLNYADDEGYFNANEELIKAALFPLRKLSKPVERALSELESIGWVALYDGGDGKSYGCVSNFRAHQVISHPRASRIKDKCVERNAVVKEVAVKKRPAQQGTKWIMDLWNESAAVGLPQCAKWTAKRDGHAKTRLKEYPDKASWVEAISVINKSTFLTGDNDRGWKASIDWLIERRDSITRLLEGRYQDDKKADYKNESWDKVKNPNAKGGEDGFVF